ncbi:unnamed protein product, partial [Allacma fusca]
HVLISNIIAGLFEFECRNTEGKQ